MNNNFTLNYCIAIASNSSSHGPNRSVRSFWWLLLLVGMVLLGLPGFSQTLSNEWESSDEEFYLITDNSQDSFTTSAVIGINPLSNRKARQISLRARIVLEDETSNDSYTLHLYWENSTSGNPPNIGWRWEDSLLVLDITPAQSIFLREGPLLRIDCWNETQNVPASFMLVLLGGIVIADNIVPTILQGTPRSEVIMDLISPDGVDYTPVPVPAHILEAVPSSEVTQSVSPPLSVEETPSAEEADWLYENFTLNRWVDVFDLQGKCLLRGVLEMPRGSVEQLYTLPPGIYIVKGRDGYGPNSRTIFKE